MSLQCLRIVALSVSMSVAMVILQEYSLVGAVDKEGS